MSVIQNWSMPASTLKKKLNAIAYYRVHVREAVAAGVIVLGHVRSENNLADVLTKALPGKKHYGLIKPLLFKPIMNQEEYQQ